MKKILLILICLLVCFPVKSEWIKMFGHEGLDGFYFENSSVNRSENLITFWTLTNFMNEKTGPYGNKYHSYKQKRLVDCKLQRIKNLRNIMTTLPMGRGDIVHETSPGYEYKWKHPTPGEFSYESIKFFCDNF